MVAAAHAALDRWGAGSGAARLIVGSRPVHTELETAIAEWKGADGAVLFPTGFAANLGVFEALASRDAFICSDELNHASIIDGCRMARAEVAVYRHGDVEHLESLVTERAAGRRVLVVTDTVFSMDGDLAPVAALRDLCIRHRALLVLDEAHAVLGPDLDAPDETIVRVGTLSKTLGSLGGFVAASQPIV
ncbi:MAG: aminotransferase class I/II-fold pyridoxal phosphate-dependent enzyme, partial [Gemmatimonadota bacterium]